MKQKMAHSWPIAKLTKSATRARIIGPYSGVTVNVTPRVFPSEQTVSCLYAVDCSVSRHKPFQFVQIPVKTEVVDIAELTVP
jgi:hypothetical protein